ncbi:hypothetical protein BLNAU_22359 [Blattamonas nauphoetae]|uniref:Uncharacterized protein n=1 Tax=Blattamonas nauphoetae TaxID=2049346 RepID=A0ABQ9WTS1_9EUKA|nr:hypothetical protein BLNAU_22359 [Blattamonas nauphoetae]
MLNGKQQSNPTRGAHGADTEWAKRQSQDNTGTKQSKTGKKEGVTTMNKERRTPRTAKTTKRNEKKAMLLKQGGRKSKTMF